MNIKLFECRNILLMFYSYFTHGVHNFISSVYKCNILVNKIFAIISLKTTLVIADKYLKMQAIEMHILLSRML